MDLQILERIRTVEERKKLFEELDMLQASLYQPRAYAKTLKTQIRTWITEVIESKNFTSSKDIESFIKDLKQELLKLTPMKLTLAFEPTDQTLERIMENFGKICTGLILDITIDQSIIGGIKISWKGKFIDLSIKKKLEVYWEALAWRT